MRHLLLIVLSGLLAACAQQSHIQLYSGSPLPESQIVTVAVPSELEVQSINGQPVSAANSITANERQLQLQPGSYRINAYYKRGFDIGGGISHEIVRGRTAIFTIDGQAGELWRLEFTQPQNLEQAKIFESQFNAWALNTRTGERHASEAGQSNSSLINALLGGANAGDEQSTVAPLGAGTTNAAAGSAAVPVHRTPARSTPVAPTPSPAASETLPHNDATLTTLQQLWNLLSPESREAFLQWVQQ